MSAVGAVMRAWLPVAFATTVLAFAGVLAWHQQLRASADEPQRALAHDAARAIADGHGAGAFLPPPLALETDEGLFLAGYDGRGVPRWSSARLHGALPAPPAGVFGHAAASGEHRLTWMPQPGVREALVIVALPAGAGYVVAGRSLHQVEARKAQVARLWVAGWAVAMLGSLVLAAWPRRRR